ncbi:hypothetical protein EVAR_102650_1 [Eumeta japonica]|uniref:Uncharacterized protein n=1 Tax=Eumeta variegata TaxID=151549 RepID=A0A4C1TUT5_EUMVA|nr:hypothetical protein EVAR_102650_1 [Eumeta japonica]
MRSRRPLKTSPEKTGPIDFCNGPKECEAIWGFNFKPLALHRYGMKAVPYFITNAKIKSEIDGSTFSSRHRACACFAPRMKLIT